MVTILKKGKKTEKENGNGLTQKQVTKGRKKVTNEKKQELLQKRKAYDPRAAIKNKKKTLDHKSSVSVASNLEKPQFHMREKSGLSVMTSDDNNNNNPLKQEEDLK